MIHRALFLVFAAVVALSGCDGRVFVNAPPGETDAGRDSGADGATLEPADGATGDRDAGEGFADAGEGFADAGEGFADAGEDASAGGDDAGDPGRDAGGEADAAAPGPSSSRQVERPLGTTAAANGFHEYLPPGYGDGTPRPLLVYWHGIGENGNGTTELAQVSNSGPTRLIRDDAWPAERPFVVLSPQHAGGGCPTASEIHDFLAFALGAYTVDTARVYLTGLSCGAIGSWNYLGEHLDAQIAAMVVIAGDGRGAWSRSGCELGRVAIWAFHGDADDVVAPAGTIAPTNDLMACPSPPRRELRVTIYPGAGHNCWTETYDLSAGHDIYAWLLTQSR
jgi:hypothetical protein